MANSNAWIRESYHENLRDELELHLPDMGTNIVFDDNIWYLDKLKRSPGHENGAITLYFNCIPAYYQDTVKYYMLMRYCERKSINTIQGNLFGLSAFFNFLDNKNNKVELHKITKSLISEYELYLSNCNSYKKSSKEMIFTAINSFFYTMKDWDVMPTIVPVGRHNPFNRTRKDRMISEKYIPEYITKQLDIAFRDERIPVYIRLMYWLLRSIPSRVTEVCSIKFNGLKPSYEGKGNWVIFIPTWKQSGGYQEPELRAIHIKYEGHGKYVIDLLREHQKTAQSLQDGLPVGEKDMLFTYTSHKLNGDKYKKNGAIEFNERNSAISITTDRANVAKWFNTICRIYKVVNEKGQPYIFTSHQLRHNGITDRFYEGFSMIEIRDMTGHKGDEMINTSYVHYDPIKVVEVQRAVNEKSSSVADKSPVYFKGRILYMDKEQEARILSNPRANRLGKIGICSDMTSCKPGLFECLDCDLCIPDADDLEYYEEQVVIWKRKTEQFKNHQFMLENAEYNLFLHQRMVDKIRNAINSQEVNDNAS